jgi:hypothetical protein
MPSMYIMAEFFFNRHEGSSTVEPFSEYKYSTKDYYYNLASKINPACESSNGPKASQCGTSTTFDASDDDATKRAKINNCLCKYADNVDTYLQKKPTDITINGVTNDNAEKYSAMTMKNINLGIGIGMMMIYVYNTNY